MIRYSPRICHSRSEFIILEVELNAKTGYPSLEEGVME